MTYNLTRAYIYIYILKWTSIFHLLCFLDKRRKPLAGLGAEKRIQTAPTNTKQECQSLETDVLSYREVIYYNADDKNKEHCRGLFQNIPLLALEKTHKKNSSRPVIRLRFNLNVSS